MHRNGLRSGIACIPLFVACLSLLLVATGCTDERTSNTADTSADASTSPRTSTLVVAAVADAGTLNPFFAHNQAESEVINLLFDALVKLEPDLSYSPALARSWETSEDGGTLTFHLREDVLWHDGEPLTASDVAFTHELAANPETGFPSQTRKATIACRVLDEHTVEFRFSNPSVDQMYDVLLGGVLPQHILADVPPAKFHDHEFKEKPIGTGPWKLAEWKRGSEIRLEAFDGYYRGRPSIDAIIFRPVIESEARVLLMKNGEVDLVTRLASDQYAELESRPELVGHALPDRAYYAIFWNLERSLFQSREIRRALTLSIDRERLVRAVLQGRGEVCHGPVSPLLWGYAPDLPRLPYDPKEASRLFAEAGWRRGADGVLARDGERFSFRLLANSGNRVKADTMTLVQGMLAELGIEVHQEVLEPRTFEDRFMHRDFDAIAGAWGVSLKMDLSTIWRSDGARNYTGYSDPELDRLIDEANAASDRETARPIWKRAQEIIVRDQPYTFLFFPQQLNVIHQRFENVRMEPTGWDYNIHDWVESPASSD